MLSSAGGRLRGDGCLVVSADVCVVFVVQQDAAAAAVSSPRGLLIPPAQMKCNGVDSIRAPPPQENTQNRITTNPSELSQHSLLLQPGRETKQWRGGFARPAREEGGGQQRERRSKQGPVRLQL